MKIVNYLFGIMLASSVISCSQNVATGRQQLTLVSSQEMMTAANQQYSQFLREQKVVNNTAQSEMVKRIGRRVSDAVTKYYNSQNLGYILDGYKWEYNLVDSKEVNAWCMPGGKIVVYTGLLPVTQSENALAVVIGHEVAHAVAEHSRERVSQGLVQQLGGVALAVAVSSKPQETQDLFMNAYGIASTYGAILPFSRKDELEADKLGLLYSAMAGYDPREAITLWERMAKLSAGQAPPEFASTHPAESTRIEKLTEQMPVAMSYYEKARSKK